MKPKLKAILLGVVLAPMAKSISVRAGTRDTSLCDPG